MGGCISKGGCEERAGPEDEGESMTVEVVMVTTDCCGST